MKVEEVLLNVGFNLLDLRNINLDGWDKAEYVKAIFKLEQRLNEGPEINVVKVKIQSGQEEPNQPQTQ